MKKSSRKSTRNSKTLADFLNSDTLNDNVWMLYKHLIKHPRNAHGEKWSS